MYERHDDAEQTGAANLVGARVPRAPWRQPSFRILPAYDAEIVVDINVSDGAFTTS